SANSSRTSTLVPGGAPAAPAGRVPPASASTAIPPAAAARRVTSRTRATAAMLGSASPRKPSVATVGRSSARASLLVAWRAKATSASSAAMPSPSSRTAISSSPPAASRTSTWWAPASSAFSTSSFTTEAGLPERVDTHQRAHGDGRRLEEVEELPQREGVHRRQDEGRARPAALGERQLGRLVLGVEQLAERVAAEIADPFQVLVGRRQV